MVAEASPGGNMGDFINMIMRPNVVARRKADNNELDAVKLLERFDNQSYSRVGTKDPKALQKIAERAYLQLGRLRSTLMELEEFNGTFAEAVPDPALAAFCRLRVVELLPSSGLASTEPVMLDDLRALIGCMERHFAADQKAARDRIASGRVDFMDLHELYKPGTEVIGPAGGLTQEMAYLVRSCHYEEVATPFGSKRDFSVEMEFFASVGDKFSAVRFQENVGAFNELRALNVLPFKLIPEASRPRLVDRGRLYAEIARGQKYLTCKSGSFLSGNVRSQGVAGDSRIMVDVETAMDFGQNPILAGHADAGPVQLEVIADYYRKAIRQGRLDKKDSSVQKDGAAGVLVIDRMVFFDAIPPERFWNCWPTVPGYDMGLKQWGHAELSGLSEIVWQEEAWHDLQLPGDRKDLIKAVVTKQHEVESIDVIQGKGEGTTFLLYGPPGTGKTLTAEAMAETLHKPLYVLSAGEMGTTPQELEKTFSAALQLCSKWECLCLVDEADIFLEKRQGNDVLRNALVCVMLRQLEYHAGILFLTTNKAKGIDPAVRSRLTLALRYDSLTEEARKEVWLNLLTRVQKGMGGGPFDFDELAEKQLNGRDIKNAIRLSMALAMEEKEDLTQAMVIQTLDVISAFRQELNEPKEDSEKEQ